VGDEFPQDVAVNIVEPREVHTTFAERVVAKQRQKVFAAWVGLQAVEGADFRGAKPTFMVWPSRAEA
jgi:hypothetical protein